MSAYTKRLRREKRALVKRIEILETAIADCPGAYLGDDCRKCGRPKWDGWTCGNCIATAAGKGAV